MIAILLCMALDYTYILDRYEYLLLLFASWFEIRELKEHLPSTLLCLDCCVRRSLIAQHTIQEGKLLLGSERCFRFR